MLCEKCKQREANVHIKQSINGVTTERNLCEVCAREEEGLMTAFSMDSLFNDLFATSLMKRGSRRLGSLFDLRPQIMPESNSRYNSEFMGVEHPLVENVELPEIHIKQGSQQQPKEKTEDDLKEQLAKAIEEENYEKAAELRDKIKKEMEKNP